MAGWKEEGGGQEGKEVMGSFASDLLWAPAEERVTAQGYFYFVPAFFSGVPSGVKPKFWIGIAEPAFLPVSYKKNEH